MDMGRGSDKWKRSLGSGEPAKKFSQLRPVGRSKPTIAAARDAHQELPLAPAEPTRPALEAEQRDLVHGHVPHGFVRSE